MSDPIHTDSDPALTCRPEDIRYRVLLAVPEALNIPHFALGVEAKRSQIQTTLIASKDEESRLVDGNVFRSLSARYGALKPDRFQCRISGRFLDALDEGLTVRSGHPGHGMVPTHPEAVHLATWPTRKRARPLPVV